MTKVFLAAGVAALAIAAPASAAPGGHGGHDKASAQERGGGHAQARADRPQVRAQAQVRQRQNVRVAENRQSHAQARATERAQVQARARQQAQRNQRQQQQAHQREMAQHQQNERAHQQQQLQAHQREMAQHHQRQLQAHQREMAQHQQTIREHQREMAQHQQTERAHQQQLAQRQQNRFEQQQNRRLEQQRLAYRQAVRAERNRSFRNARLAFADLRGRGLIDGCPPGLWMKNNGCMPPGQAARLLNTPIANAARIASLREMPRELSYFYPDTPDYYYRYGNNGYLYQVNRRDNLIASLLPLVTGGYVAGQYLPTSYMNSYVPASYGFNNLYPDSPYSCNRYANGVVYQVDCASGLVENAVPLYAGGYGVGQMLPSAYNYYNLPTQYRSMYYNSADAGYWYAPGAIYQYNPSNSLITSVAALLSPGLTVGQALPAGYGVYNVPYAYRQTYYDTPNAWYRYNNGYIYQVDPTTQLVTAIVASLLT